MGSRTCCKIKPAWMKPGSPARVDECSDEVDPRNAFTGFDSANLRALGLGLGLDWTEGGH